MWRFNSFLGAAVIWAVGAQLGYPQQQGVAWQPDIATAQQIAGNTNRLVLVHFWAPSCKPCAQLDHEIFSRPETAQALAANFVCVKINSDESAEVARAYNVTMLPTDVVLSADGRLIAQLRCPLVAGPYLQQLGQVAAGYRQLSGQIAAGANRTSEYANSLGGRVQDTLAGPALTGAGAAMAQASRPSDVLVPSAETAPQAATTTGSNMPSTSATQGPAISAYSNDRYSDYFRRRQAEASGAVASVGAAVQGAVGTATEQASRYAPAPAAPLQPALQAEAPAAAGNYPPQMPATSDPRAQTPSVGIVAPQVAAIQLPPGSPPLALDGYCSVLLKEQKRWGVGDRRWGAVHRGRTYLFTGPDEQKKFLESPDSYAPVMSGNDPVVSLDSGQAVPGKREHGVFFENRVYLFSDEASLARFYQNPGRYAAEVVQAMRQP